MCSGSYGTEAAAGLAQSAVLVEGVHGLPPLGRPPLGLPLPGRLGDVLGNAPNGCMSGPSGGNSDGSLRTDDALEEIGRVAVDGWYDLWIGDILVEIFGKFCV